MNSNEMDDPATAKARAKLLEIASQFVGTPSVLPQFASMKNLRGEMTEPAKQTELSPETDLKQMRNDVETNLKHFALDQANHASSSHLPVPNIELETLPSDVQNRIFELVESESLNSATQRITARRPFGLGIKTNRSAVYRFYKKRQAARLATYRDDAASNAAQLLKNADATDADFVRVTQHLIKLRLLESTMVDCINPNNILALTKSLDRLRATDHAERRLRLAEKKAERDATPQETKVPSP